MKKAIKTAYFNQIEKRYYNLTYILTNVRLKIQLTHNLFTLYYLD